MDRALGVPTATAIARARHRAVAALLRQVFHVDRAQRGSLRDRLGAWSMHPVWGVPILLAVLFVAYEFVGVFGAGVLVGLVEDGLFGKVINPAVGSLVTRFVPVAEIPGLIRQGKIRHSLVVVALYHFDLLRRGAADATRG